MFYSSYPARTALGTAIVFFTLVVFLTWAFGQAKRVDGPSTGESCAEFVARVWPTMSSHQPPSGTCYCVTTRSKSVGLGRARKQGEELTRSIRRLVV
jgi:hypothetical protein